MRYNGDMIDMMVISYNQRYPTWVWLEIVYICLYDTSNEKMLIKLINQAFPCFWTPPQRIKMENKSTCKVLALWLHYFRVEPPTRIYWDWGSFGFPISSLWVPQEFALHDRILVRSNFAMLTWAFQWTLWGYFLWCCLKSKYHEPLGRKILQYPWFPRNSSLSPLTSFNQSIPWSFPRHFAEWRIFGESSAEIEIRGRQAAVVRAFDLLGIYIVWQRSAGKTKPVV